MALKDQVKDKIKKSEEDADLAIVWFYFLSNCCEIGLTELIDISSFFKAEIVFELEKMRFVGLF